MYAFIPMGNRINESFQYTLSTGRVKTFESAMNLYNSTVEPRRPRILLTPKGSTTLQNYTQPDQSSFVLIHFIFHWQHVGPVQSLPPH